MASTGSSTISTATSATPTNPAVTSVTDIDPYDAVSYVSLNIEGVNEVESVIFTCPANCIAIVRSVFALCTSDDTPTAFDLRLNNLYLCRKQPLPVANPYEHIEDNTVLLHAGDVLRLRRAGDGPCDIHINLLQQAKSA